MDDKLHHSTRDLTGQRFGALVAVKTVGSRKRKRIWAFHCDCGKTCTKVGCDVTKGVRRGGTPNCGCLTKELIGRGNTGSTTHGKSQHPMYFVWRAMKDRCRLPTHQAWKNYGARGIAVCERWEHSFENFWEDMSGAYKPSLELDRIDNDRGYSPENCRWTTRTVNANNKRSTVYVNTPRGKMTVGQASRAFGIGAPTLMGRIDRFWPDEKLFIKPK